MTDSQARLVADLRRMAEKTNVVWDFDTLMDAAHEIQRLALKVEADLAGECFERDRAGNGEGMT